MLRLNRREEELLFGDLTCRCRRSLMSTAVWRLSSPMMLPIKRLLLNVLTGSADSDYVIGGRDVAAGYGILARRGH